jgi:hypothetical protein
MTAKTTAMTTLNFPEISISACIPQAVASDDVGWNNRHANFAKIPG